MARLKEIVKFFNEYLKNDEIEDESWNGLQVEGKEDVKKVMFAVDAGLETFSRAIKEKADLIVVHHGLFWKSSNPTFRGLMKKGIELLQKNGISVYATHLPLDRHHIVGNNAQLLKLIGAKIDKELFFHKGKNIGWLGIMKKNEDAKSIAKILEKELNTSCKVLGPEKKKIRRVAVCSGGGNYDDFFEAIENDADLFITGDSFDVFHQAKDNNFNVIFAGHHATETVGVKALSEVAKRRFKINTVFIDIPTGL